MQGILTPLINKYNDVLHHWEVAFNVDYYYIYQIQTYYLMDYINREEILFQIQV